MSATKLGASAPANDYTLRNNEDGSFDILRGTTVVQSISATGKVVAPANAQTVQNVAASRVLGTTYTNTTVLPITVMVGLQGTAGIGQVAAANIGGVSVYGTAAPAASQVSAVFFVVPAGVTYSVVASPTTGQAIVTWVEVR
jgi:hypothetical protein